LTTDELRRERGEGVLEGCGREVRAAVEGGMLKDM